MMKKLLVLMLVLGLASVANATTLSWDVGASYTLSGTGTVYIVADDALAYVTTWIDDTDASIISSITALTAAGDDAAVQNPAQSGYADWWTVEAADTGTPFNIASGNQFAVALSSVATSGTADLVLDGFSPYPQGGPTTLNITFIPEPTTIALLGLGGLFLLRRRK
ncbi:MAG: PEP-CTERM sorting domain-containing protein [Planctomycetota bacterium]|jgi:hypothetical protein